MATRQVTRVLHGIGVPERRFSATRYVPGVSPGLDTSQSTVTQSEGRAGVFADLQDPASPCAWVGSGEQTEAVKLEVIQAGAPPVTWPTVKWRTDAETTVYHRGQFSPAVTTAFTCPRPSTSGTILAFKQLTRIPRTEKIALVSAAASCSAAALDDRRVLYHGSVAKTREFDPDTWTWGTEQDLTQSGVWISTDGGAPERRGTLSGSSGTSIAWHPDTETLILVSGDAGAGTLTHSVSRDMGASWDAIEAPTSIGKSADVQVGPDGTIFVFYSRFSDSQPCVRILATPASLLSDAAEILVAGTASDYVAGAVDPGTGHVWCVYRGNATARTLRTRVSKDGGATWTLIGDPGYDTQDGGNTITDISACWAAGRLWVAMNIARSPGTYDASVVVVALGCQATSDEWPISAGTAGGVLYVPLDLPTDMGWTVAGTAPTIDATTGLLDITTAAAQSTNQLTLTRTANDVWAHVSCRLVSGGAVGTDDVSFRLRGAENLTPSEAIVTVRMSTTQFRVRDNVAASDLTTQTFDTSTREVEFLVRLVWTGSAWLLYLWWRVTGKARFEFIQLVPTGNAAAPATTHELRWGHRANTTSQSRWAVVQFSDTQEGLGGISVGPYPGALVDMADTADSATGRGYLSVRGGPALIGEEWQSYPAYRYGLDRCINSRSLSFGKLRTIGNGQALIAWDLGDEGPLGHPLFLYVGGANVRDLGVDYWDGAAWQQAGALDLAIAAGLSWDAEGEAVYPIASGATAGRPLQAQELMNGHFWTGTAGTAYRVRGNTSGLWGPTGSVSTPPRLRVEGAPSAAGGTTGILVAPSGVLVIHPASEVVARYWRVRIPAAQPTPSGNYEIAAMALGWLGVLGEPADGGWQRARRSGIQAGGRVSTRPLRSLTWSWTDGVELRNARSGIANYVGPASGLPSVAWQDVEGVLSGVLDRMHWDPETGELAETDLPVLALASVPTATASITDPTLFVWGALSLSVSGAHAAGVEGVDEILRIDALTVSEEP